MSIFGDQGLTAKPPLKSHDCASVVEEFDGITWKCDWGFKERGERCEPIDLPDNAFLRESGKYWDCIEPFVKRGDVCVNPALRSGD